MKVVYIAHKIAGDVANNIDKVEHIVSHLLNLRYDYDVWPIAPYLDACKYLSDLSKQDRDDAFQMNHRYFSRCFIDEIWICSEISKGIQVELNWAKEFGIPARTPAPHIIGL